MNGKPCLCCKTETSVSYNKYCPRCLRIKAGRSPEPKFKRDSSNTDKCCKCKVNPRLSYHKYCKECKNAAVNEWNKNRELTESERQKATVRRYAKTLLDSGRIQKQPCLMCGNPEVEIHHLSYAQQTRHFVWLCQKDHVACEQLKREGQKIDEHLAELAGIDLSVPSPVREIAPIGTDLLTRLAMASNVAENGCFLFTDGGSKWNGYVRIHWGDKMYKIHRLIWQYHYGQIPDGQVVRHKCKGSPNCWRIEHLRLGTQGQNNGDRKEDGRNGDLTGENNGRAKLTKEQAIWLRFTDRDGLTQRQCAEKLGVSLSAVLAVIHLRTWRMLEKPIP